MKNRIILSAIALLLGTSLTEAQEKFITKTGFVKFFSSAPLEDIEAENNDVQSIVDLTSGKVAISIPIQSFEFDKSLMQEHFNENYMESDKYPKASFQGSFSAGKKLESSAPGTYQVEVDGDITIHGVTRPLVTRATLTIAETGVRAQTKFNIRIADFDIEIPRIVFKNIAEIVEVTADLKYNRFQDRQHTK